VGYRAARMGFVIDPHPFRLLRDGILASLPQGTDGMLPMKTRDLNELIGCIAKLKVKARGEVRLSRLCRADDAEQAGNERNLPGNIAFRFPSDLPFADHVYRFDSLHRPLRRPE
jgi:hypothetical protein